MKILVVQDTGDRMLDVVAVVKAIDQVRRRNTPLYLVSPHNHAWELFFGTGVTRLLDRANIAEILDALGLGGTSDEISAQLK